MYQNSEVDETLEMMRSIRETVRNLTKRAELQNAEIRLATHVLNLDATPAETADGSGQTNARADSPSLPDRGATSSKPCPLEKPRASEG